MVWQPLAGNSSCLLLAVSSIGCTWFLPSAWVYRTRTYAPAAAPSAAAGPAGPEV